MFCTRLCRSSVSCNLEMPWVCPRRRANSGGHLRKCAQRNFMHLGGAEEAWAGKHRGGQDEDTTHFSFVPRATSAARPQRVAEDARVQPDNTPVLLRDRQVLRANYARQRSWPGPRVVFWLRRHDTRWPELFLTSFVVFQHGSRLWTHVWRDTPWWA